MITIGITAFNEGDYLMKAWDSVLKQTDNRWEAVMVLDGGADNKTQKIYDRISHPSLRKIKLTENKGPYYTRTLAINHTDTEWYCQLDGDDRFPPNIISNIYQIIKKQPEIEYIFGKELKFQDKEYFISSEQLSIEEQICYSIPYGQAPIKKQLFTKLGGFYKPLYQGGADWDFWLRVIQSGARGINTDQILYEHRRDRRSTNVGIKRLRKQYEVAKIVINHNPDYFGIKNRKNKCLAYAYELSAREYKRIGNRKKAAELAQLALTYGNSNENLIIIINEGQMLIWRYILRRLSRYL